MSEEEYKLSFRIRRCYFDAIRDGTKPNEIRRCCEFWDPRAWKATKLLLAGKKVTAVLVCGKDILYKPVLRITMCNHASEAMGREPSEQGRKDVGEGAVWAFWFK